jgi:Skp family chaperone for outer membrane proteins
MILMALLVAAPGAAQQSEPPPPAVVAVVDLARVSDETLVGQLLANQLETLQAELESELGTRRQRVEERQVEFQSLVEAFQEEREGLADADAQAREADLLERQQSLQELIQAAQVDADAAQRRFQNEVARLTAQLESDIRPHLNEVAESLGVNLLLPRSQTVFNQPELDITDRVIARVDDAFRAGEVAHPVR